MKAFLVVLLLFLGTAAQPAELVLCEQASDRVIILPADAGWDESEILWSWSAQTSPGLPAEHRPWFSLPSEAKPVVSLTQLLITAAGGGVALVRLADQQVLFHAYAGQNPHSAELLPDGQLVAASSTDDRLRLFRTGADTASYTDYVLPGAHGVVWDAQGQRLWALGYGELRAYAYLGTGERSFLEPMESVELPGTGGHDLFPRLGRPSLFVTTDLGVWEFDLASRRFVPVELLEGQLRVKSIGELLPDGPLVFLSACEEWWCDTVRFAGPSGRRAWAGARFYKARWFVDNPFSYGPVAGSTPVGPASWGRVKAAGSSTPRGRIWSD